jgi:hypothetical protein
MITGTVPGATSAFQVTMVPASNFVPLQSGPVVTVDNPKVTLSALDANNKFTATVDPSETPGDSYNLTINGVNGAGVEIQHVFNIPIITPPAQQVTDFGLGSNFVGSFLVLRKERGGWPPDSAGLLFYACPYCNSPFRVLITSHIDIQAAVLVICQHCGKIAKLENDALSLMPAEEQETIKQTLAYKLFIEPAQDIAYRFRMAQKARWN